MFKWLFIIKMALQALNLSFFLKIDQQGHFHQDVIARSKVTDQVLYLEMLSTACIVLKF